MFRKLSFLVIYHLGDIDLIQSSFPIIPKIKFANLFKSVHYAIIIPVLSDPLNLGNVEREKITKFWTSQERKELFQLNKKHFS